MANVKFEKDPLGSQEEDALMIKNDDDGEGRKLFANKKANKALIISGSIIAGLIIIATIICLIPS